MICFDFSAFRNCSNHIFVFADEKNIRDVGENITFINDSYIKFNYNENSELMSIDDNAFSYIGIQKISIPLSVIEVGYISFENCYKLDQIFLDKKSYLRSYNFKHNYRVEFSYI